MSNQPAMWLNATIRRHGKIEVDPGDIHVSLPLERMWFEDTTNDLHLQFFGHEEDNICPHQNDYANEFEIPWEAQAFRAWVTLHLGINLTSAETMTATFCSCIIVSRRQAKAPPADILTDLVKHWESPNR